VGRTELESFRHFIVNTIDSLVGSLDGLDEAELNWRPGAPATNSLYAIVTHVLGNAEENLLGTLLTGRGTGRSARVQHREGSRGRIRPALPQARRARGQRRSGRMAAVFRRTGLRAVH